LKFEILGNYPNPFNGSTNIEYSLSQPGRVTVVIYDILGRKIENLIDENQAAGKYLINWNADNYPTGIYFVRLKMGDYSDTIKITMIR
jgi:hypothetical protein